MISFEDRVEGSLFVGDRGFIEVIWWDLERFEEESQLVMSIELGKLFDTLWRTAILPPSLFLTHPLFDACLGMQLPSFNSKQLLIIRCDIFTIKINMKSKYTSPAAQTCLVSLISLNQLKRDFEVFQQEVLEQVALMHKQSMEDILSLWRLFSQRGEGNKLTVRNRNSQELESAFQIINEKQEEISNMEKKLVEAEESKEELLNILQRQTELCTQIRDEQFGQAAAFNLKIQNLQKTIKDNDTLIKDLKVEASVLKRLLKEEYQIKGEPSEQSKYLTNSIRELDCLNSSSKNLLRQRKSETGIFNNSSNKKNTSTSKSKELKSMKVSTSNLSKTLKVNESSNSIKSQIEKIIQKAVKENCQKHKR